MPALFATCLLALAKVAHAQPMFPPDIAESVWWSDLIDDEPPLWRAERLDGFKARIRLSISGIAKRRVLIRIDEKANGQGVGRVALVSRAGQGLDLIADVDRAFRVSGAQLQALHAQIAKARLWSAGPEEHWTNDEICVDGEQLVFERLDASGYRFSEANAQCTAPAEVLDVARTMIELSGERWPLLLLN